VFLAWRQPCTPQDMVQAKRLAQKR
jgi:hypothetical protein